LIIRIVPVVRIRPEAKMNLLLQQAKASDANLTSKFAIMQNVCKNRNDWNPLSC
jgi:hypothetical protein